MRFPILIISLYSLDSLLILIAFSRLMFDYVKRSTCGDKMMVNLSDPVPDTASNEEKE